MYGRDGCPGLFQGNRSALVGVRAQSEPTCIPILTRIKFQIGFTT
jgi:hypothetical protein